MPTPDPSSMGIGAGISALVVGLRKFFRLNHEVFPPCHAKVMRDFPWDRSSVIHCTSEGHFTIKSLLGERESKASESPPSLSLGSSSSGQEKGPVTTHDEYQVFLSHNSGDKAMVRKVRDALEERGVRCWLDEEELLPGRRWQDSLEAGMRKSRSVAVFIAARGLGQWQEEELRTALSMAVKSGLPVIPVLLPGASDSDSLPPFLANRSWVDLRDGLSEDRMRQLLSGIAGERQPLASSIEAADEAGKLKVDNPEEVVELEVDVYESFFLRAYHGSTAPIYPTIIARLVHRFLNHDRDRTVITGLTSSVWSAQAPESTEEVTQEIWRVRVPDRSLAIPPPRFLQRITDECRPDRWFSQFGPGDVPSTGLELEARSVSDWFASEFHLNITTSLAVLSRDLWVRFCWRSLGSQDGHRIFPVPDHALPLISEENRFSDRR